MSRLPRDYIFGTGPDAVMVIDARTAATLLKTTEVQELIQRIASRTSDTKVADQLVALGKLKHEFIRGGHTRVTGPTGEPHIEEPFKDWCSVKEAARRIGVEQSAIRQALLRKQLQAKKIDDRNYIRAADVALYRTRSQ